MLSPSNLIFSSFSFSIQYFHESNHKPLFFPYFRSILIKIISNYRLLPKRTPLTFLVNFLQKKKKYEKKNVRRKLHLKFCHSNQFTANAFKIERLVFFFRATLQSNFVTSMKIKTKRNKRILGVDVWVCVYER